jgi:hypothetical protein
LLLGDQAAARGRRLRIVGAAPTIGVDYAEMAFGRRRIMATELWDSARHFETGCCHAVCLELVSTAALLPSSRAATG